MLEGTLNGSIFVRTAWAAHVTARPRRTPRGAYHRTSWSPVRSRKLPELPLVEHEEGCDLRTNSGRCLRFWRSCRSWMSAGATHPAALRKPGILFQDHLPARRGVNPNLGNAHVQNHRTCAFGSTWRQHAPVGQGSYDRPAIERNHLRRSALELGHLHRTAG